MTSCNSLENLYYNIYEPATCSKYFNGYPKRGSLEDETYHKANNFDKCSHKTIYGAPWESVLNFKWEKCKGIVYSNKSGNFLIKGTVSEPGILK